MKNTVKAIQRVAGFAAVIAAITLMILPLAGCPTDGGGAPAVITIAAIAGVTAPVTGAPPVTAITPTTQYTGTVTWSGDPETFAAGTEYTATITLTAKTGFTLKGVTANFFTVTGATTVSNAADSGVVTANFPATDGTPPPPPNGISLSVNSLYTFASANSADYTPPPLSITITNTSEEATGDLTISLSGTNTGSFTLSATSIEGIAVNGTAGFTVSPKPGLAIGTYTATVTVTGDNGIFAAFNVSFTVNGPSGPGIDPVYSISLSKTGHHDFAEAIAGYGAQTPLSVTVTNTGNQATGALTAALGGANTNSFTLSKTSINSITVDGTDTFTVVPNTGLSAGIYDATVTVVGGNGITAAFSVRFTVNAASHGISLSATGTHTFTEANIGYGAQTPLSVTVTNTNEHDATGALTVALSGTNAGSFTLSKTSIDSIEAGGSSADAFTVVPKTGLAGGVYNAAVTVSGGNGITAGFNVSFTVAVYGVSLPADHTFTAAIVGYGALTPYQVTVTNTGNQATGALTAALSGTNASNFTLSTTSINSIAVDSTGSFTVVPNTGLAANTYTATVTVTGGNGISAAFNVSFTVNAAPQAATPVATPAAGTYYEAQTVTLTATSGAAIYYTLDGTTPPYSSTLYTGPISIGAGTKTLKAVAVKEGMNDSEVLTAEYTVILLPYDYTITGSGAAFTAKRDGSVIIGTADQPIQDVINAIKTNAAGNPCTIQFGDGTNTLDIGGSNVTLITFDGWTGLVTLTGKLTSSVDYNGNTIRLENGSSISITSSTEITGTGSQARLIYNNSTGAVNISGGTVSTTQYNAWTIVNASTGTVNISGGTVSTNNTTGSSNGRTISNDSTGAVNISGGTVSSVIGYAVYNSSTGKITVSQANAAIPTLITSGCYGSSYSTIRLASSGNDTSVRLEITGGTVENTSTNTSANGDAIYNASTGAVTISGGTVKATGTATGSQARAIVNGSTGALNISGGTVQVTGVSGGNLCRAILNSSTGTITITGGRVTATGGYSIYNTNSAATVTITSAATITGSRYQC